MLFLLLFSQLILGSSDLYKRNEEYQPQISSDFPHILGSERLLKWLDKSVDPCTDFYKYSCGGFEKKFKDYKTIDVLNLMQQTNSILMEQILSQNSSSVISETKADNLIFEKTKTYYDSCLNVNSINSRGFAPIKPLAEQIVNDGMVKQLALMTMSANLFKIGVKSFFKVTFGKAEGVDLDTIGLSFLPSVAYQLKSHEPVSNVLSKFVQENIITFPAGYNLEIVSKWIYGLEKQLSSFISILDKKQGAKSKSDYSESMTLRELSAETGLDWSYFTSRLGLGLTDCRVFFYGSKQVFVSVLKTMMGFSQRDMVYFYLWRLGMSHFNKLSREYYDLQVQIQQYSQRSENEDKHDHTDVFQRNCVDEVGVFMNYLSGSVFIKYSFNETQKATATEMIESLFSAFGERLAGLQWMDAPTRQAALEKLDNMAKIVGVPDWLKDSQKVYDFYSSLDLSQNYFENAVKAQAFSEIKPSLYQYEKSQVSNKFAREDILVGFPWQLNAFHITDYVQIQINNGILQRPLLSATNRKSMNFGSLGMINGHEITHGFDSIGNKYDAHGTRTNSWWSKQSAENFAELSQCYVHQYNEYDIQSILPNVPHKFVNGKNTLSENIADNGGLTIAYAAWKNQLLKDGETETTQPMTEFQGLNDEQVFFISFAQTWCLVPDAHMLEYSVDNDVHSPNQIRVRGVVENSKEWANAFQCPLKREPCSLY